MASFGWSAGDIVATINLVNRVVQCIGGAHDARVHFQELLSELQGLSRALSEISELTRIPGQTPEIQALKFASCSCGETLQRFYEKIRPFEDTLGAASTQSKLKAVPRMVRWELLIKKDVPELRSYLVAHVGSLNLRLSTALLKTSSTSQLQGRRTDQKQDINANLLQQLNKEQATMVEKIGRIPTVDTVPKLDSLLSIAIGVWKSQNEILSHLAKASHNLPPPDLDHTWAQAPVKFEDALGRRFMIPSEYDWDKVEAIIQAQFKKGPGCVKVQSGDYELFDRRTGHSISASNFFGLIPGSYITMTIILGRYRGGGLVPEGCTRIGCRSSRVRMINSETMTCMECQSTFRKAYETLPRPMKAIISDPVAKTNKAHEVDHATWMDLRYYKNLSIYFVELPATPAKFREKYPRDYPLPPPQLEQTSLDQSLLQPANHLSTVSRKKSIITRYLGGIRGLEASEPQMTPQRNSCGLRSTLQRSLSRTPLARLNFHSSAQERYSSRRSKKPLNDLGKDLVLPPETYQPNQHQDIVLPEALQSSLHGSAGRIYDSTGFLLPTANSSSIVGSRVDDFDGEPRNVGTEDPKMRAETHSAPNTTPKDRGNVTPRMISQEEAIYRRVTPFKVDLPYKLQPRPPLSPPPAHSLRNFSPTRPSNPADNITYQPSATSQVESQVRRDESFSIVQGNVPNADPPEPPRLRSVTTNQTLGSTLQSRDMASTSSDFWTPGVVNTWLKQNQFSRDWVQTFTSLNIHGPVFLELGSGFGGRGDFGMMYQQVFPRLAKECSCSGTGWDQVKEREEGKRLRRLIRGIVAGKSDMASLISTDGDMNDELL